MRRTISDDEARKVLEDGAETVTEEDIQRVITRADDIQRKFTGHSPLGRFIDDMKIMISMIKDFWSKNYREVPWWTVGAVVTALLYVLNPVDIVPDFIPFFGLLDDAAVVSACLFFVEKDLSRYKNWKDGITETEEEEQS
ncbi:MAG: DUF1232 domain-containing protein [Candidatus Sabulitectum sp.]|nr:DUF1232 domain-containing protein [Candidatus Sabulitectum sp.]